MIKQSTARAGAVDGNRHATATLAAALLGFFTFALDPVALTSEERKTITMTDQQNTGWTGGQRAFGDFAAGMVHYTDRVLFDEVWERPELSKRDRSLITVAALTAMGK